MSTSTTDITSEDPPAYLALSKFSQKIKCPRTGSPVSYADIGDEDGVPLLWMMPSGGSRWFAAAHDPLCRRYGIRLIVVDRPGIGASPVVPLEKRIEVSCLHVVSVLEHLHVKPAHLLAASAGIYYALHLLINHSKIFAHGLETPPNVYMISPWSPLLPPDSPDYYPSYFTWIPTPLISTQHYTLPGLMKAGQQAATIWNSGQKVWTSAMSWMKGWSTAPGNTNTDPSSVEGRIDKEPVALPVDTPPPPASETREGHEQELQEESEDEGGVQKRKSLWGPCECCISCLVTEYFHHENFEGVGQDHLICLNRLNANTGPEWIENALSKLDTVLLARQEGSASQRIPLHIWWGWLDGMVPRKGQLWLNKTLGKHSESLDITIHDVEDGDHNDLYVPSTIWVALGRRDGIYQVYEMVSSIGGGLRDISPKGK